LFIASWKILKPVEGKDWVYGSSIKKRLQLELELKEDIERVLEVLEDNGVKPRSE